MANNFDKRRNKNRINKERETLKQDPIGTRKCEKLRGRKGHQNKSINNLM